MLSTKHDKAIGKANDFIKSKKEEVANQKYRNHFHFMAPVGWINDPNGLICINGQYHMFYQHYPYAPHWSSMHWGHAVSHDLVHWDNLPVALAPSEPYDAYEKGGCFSGCAVYEKGVISLIYTAASKIKEEIVQSQCLATSTDGINFKKYENNPIISTAPNSSTADFRDPKIWWHNNLWYMVVGTCHNSLGKVVLFKSLDLKSWSYCGVLSESSEQFGFMWECPDFFELGDSGVLVVSPMGTADNTTLYFTGKMDYSLPKFEWDILGKPDYGCDFYAPQTLTDGNDRRIMIGWMRPQMPQEDFEKLTSKLDWFGTMSLPRVVNICEDGKLCFEPIEELKFLRKDHFQMGPVNVCEEELEIKAGDGLSYEILADFDVSGCDATEFGFVLRESEKEQTLLKIDLASSKIILDREKADAFHQKNVYCDFECEDNNLTLNIFVDTSMIEVFANNGKSVFSANIFPSESSRKISLYAKEGKVKLNKLETWGVSSIWEKN